MADQLSVQVTSGPGYLLVVVAGELDLATAPVLRQRAGELLSTRVPVVMDLDRLDFVDASGLGVLVGVVKRAEAAGVALRLVCAQQPIRRLMQITGLDRRLPLAHTRQQAAAALPGDRPPDLR